MDASLLRYTGHICRVCRASLLKSVRQRSLVTASRGLGRGTSAPLFRQQRAPPHGSKRLYAQIPDISSADRQPRRLDPAQRLNLEKVNASGQALLKQASIPTEEETLQVLKGIESAAQDVAEARRSVEPANKTENTPASAILSLDFRPQAHPRASSNPMSIPAATVNLLSSLAYKIITHPTVFINPDILSTYVSIQSLLLRPTSLPEVFDLYSTKPVPSPTKEKASHAIKYVRQNPNAISSAVPLEVANRALDAAIEVRELPLALDIISTTFCAPAFRRSKIFKKAAPPAAAAALAPVAVYALASQLATLQTGVPPESFVPAAFAAILTYVGSVGTVGYIAITTTNDHMERVTWIEGTPLWERWAREEERAALDRVALAWGFREKWRWGEEEGVEWEGLKEWIGVKGMILDRVSLMEGME